MPVESALATAAQLASVLILALTFCTIVFAHGHLPSRQLETLQKELEALEAEHDRFQDAPGVPVHLAEHAHKHLAHLQRNIRKHVELVYAGNSVLYDYLQLVLGLSFTMWRTSCAVRLFQHQLVKHQNEGFAYDRCFGDRDGNCCICASPQPDAANPWVIPPLPFQDREATLVDVLPL